MKKNVGMAEFEICKSPEVLSIIGLGSCVAVAVYHGKTRTGGLAHVMLPEGRQENIAKPGKYANTAINALLQQMKKETRDKEGFTAKIAGGAQMFKITKGFSIGEKNIAAVKKELNNLGIRIVGEDVGNSYGRTVTFSVEDGSLKIKSIYGESVI